MNFMIREETGGMSARLMVLAAVLAILVLSCSSLESGDRRVPELKAVLVEDIEELLSEGRAEDAVQDIDYLWRRGRLSSDEKERWVDRAVAGIAADYRRSVEARSYYEAYGSFLSLVALDAHETLEDADATELLLSLAGELEAEGQRVSALVLRLRLLDSLSGQELEKTQRIAEELGSAPAMLRLMRRAEELGLDIGAGKPEAPPEPSTKSEMQKGMVTIWVDKGIRVEKGIGYPDRVMGSGFFIDSDGYLVTNYHVIESEVDPEYEGYSRLYVRMSGRPEERIPAKVIGWDRIFDLALIKVEAEPEFVFHFAGDVVVEPGEKIFTIGSPLDPYLENTISSGIVSATGRRRLLQMGDVVQIDAPVNPGNSGGPMLDERGELAGVVFAGFQPFQGLNFAIPVHWLNKILPRLYLGEKVAHPWLGMALLETETGLEVIYTVPGGAAARGGVEAGDLIEGINGTAFVSTRNLQDYLLDIPVGTVVRVRWRRDGEPRSGFFTLQERPDSPIETAAQRDRQVNLLVPLFGMELEKTGRFLWETNYTIKRVLPGSIADETGLSVDDPVNVQNWKIDEESRYAILQIFVKKRTTGFLESVVQLLAYLELDSFV
jgi:S1-C subfamily serine protease